jgi:hypothetical protein
MNKTAAIPFLFLFLLLAANLSAKTTVVKTIEELIDANASASPGDTISLADGTYTIASYGIAVRTTGLTFKSKSGIRENVTISGAGMLGDIEYGFWVAAHRITIRDVTIRDVYYHCIQTDVNVDSLRVINCVLMDGREQLLKVPSSSENADPSEGGLVEGCLFEFSKGIAQQYYTGGVDCHFSKNWKIRNNVFKNIRSPENQVAEHAVHFWNNSEGTLVENNVIINCDRGIGFGLGDSPHKGGVIRNNMIYHAVISGVDNADVGIGLETCTDAQVYNNTIYFDNDYSNAIEYRFAATKNITITNNLTNKMIRQRDNASANVSNNVTDAQASWFIAANTGDLHIRPTITSVIDKAVSIEGLSSDIDGQTRQIGAIDIGADEYYPSSIRGFSPQAWNERYLLNHVAGRTVSFGIFNVAGRHLGTASSRIIGPDERRIQFFRSTMWYGLAAGTYVVKLPKSAF